MATAYVQKVRYLLKYPVKAVSKYLLYAERTTLPLEIARVAIRVTT